MKTRPRRILFVRCLMALPLLAALILGGARLERWRHERPMGGRLAVSETLAEPVRCETGVFILSWTPERGGVLRVFHQDHPQKALWESLPGRAFVSAAEGIEHVTERRGMFRVRDRVYRRRPHQFVDSISIRDGAVNVTGKLHGWRNKHEVGFTLTFEHADEDRLRFHLSTDNDAVNRLYLTGASTPDEAFYGFGAQFTHFNLKGRRVPILVMEQGIGRGKQPLTLFMNLIAGAGGAWHTSYAVAPHYLTSAMRSLFLESYACSFFDLRRPDCVQITLFDGTMEGAILAGNTPADLIRAYTAATGRMRALPDWILDGAVIGMQGGTDRVRQVWNQLEQHDTPIAAFWLQDWVGQRRTIVGKQLWWNWELDRRHYPNWEQLVEDLAQREIRVMTYINPFIIDPQAKPHYERNLFQEALDNNYLIRRPDGTPYLVKNTDFSAAMVDFTYPDARDWMKRIIHEQVIAYGASGWMADFGEALPWDAQLHSGESAAAFHNRYPEIWAQVNREAIEETGRGDDFVFFMRSGYRNSPRHATLFWLGDQMTSWDRHDGMKSAVTAMLSSGMSGYAFNHSDIGGYTAVVTPLFTLRRSPELLKRWMEMNAFSPVFRTHEGVAPDANHQFYSDDDTLAHFSRCAQLYVGWAEYRKELVRQAAETGLPVVRHPFIHYPNDPRVRSMDYEQFMVGDTFMVAPVLDPGVSVVTCYLPPGQWTHLWSARGFSSADGLDVTVPAPLGEPAVFYTSGAAAARDYVDNLIRLGLLPTHRR